jgi:hypothetical protein
MLARPSRSFVAWPDAIRAVRRAAASWPLWLVWLLALTVTVLAARYGARAVGGADEYGYVSQADLWLKGSVKVQQPFARQVPWPFGDWTFAPLGYRAHPSERGIIVPIYSPGLPLMFALAKLIGGQDAIFYVVPICAALLILATYSIGRRLGARGADLIAAWLVATSPTVLFMSTTPMSDVPIAAVYAWAFYLLLGTTITEAAGAGLLCALAVLIRPNLACLAGVLAMRYVFALRDPGMRRQAALQLIVFSAAVLPGAVAIAILNNSLYGSPFASGYGKLSALFKASRVTTNLRLYVRWVAEAHTPFAWCGIAAILLPLRRLWPGVRDRSIFFVMAAFVVVVWAIYCAWLVFDVWWFSRFLLPTWPFIMLGAGSVVTALLRASPRWLRPVLVAGAIALGVVQLRFAATHNAFEARDTHRRFVAVARLVQRLTPRDSVVISLDYSGPIRYYGSRMTMNFSWIPGHWLDPMADWLKKHGVRTYMAVEERELPEIRQRFAGNKRLQALDRPPLAIYEEPGRALLFDLTDPLPPELPTVTERNVDPGPRAPRPLAPPRLVFREIESRDYSPKMPRIAISISGYRK